MVHPITICSLTGVLERTDQRKWLYQRAILTADVPLTILEDILENNSSICAVRNGNPLQYSCLENPVDGGAWWAVVHKVAQSRTWLKWLSMHACSGEGNGNPLQYSCLENSSDRGAWWAAVYGVSQSQTRLKWHGSSSSSWIANGKRSDNTLVSIPAVIVTYVRK